MDLLWLDNKNMMPTCEPLIAAISYDESKAIIGLLDEGVEHSALNSNNQSANHRKFRYELIFMQGANYLPLKNFVQLFFIM